QQQKKGQFQRGQFPGFGGGGLLSSEAVDKLKLTAEQKEKYTKIEEEFKEKQKASGEKLREAFQSKDKDKIKDAFQNVRGDAEKLRTDYLTKVESLLTAEQKKTFADVKNEQPRFGGRGPGAGGGGASVIPPRIQEKLGLSEEQKKKIEAVQ